MTEENLKSIAEQLRKPQGALKVIRKK
jgi:hypothetical protein